MRARHSLGARSLGRDILKLNHQSQLETKRNSSHNFENKLAEIVVLRSREIRFRRRKMKMSREQLYWKNLMKRRRPSKPIDPEMTLGARQKTINRILKTREPGKRRFGISLDNKNKPLKLRRDYRVQSKIYEGQREFSPSDKARHLKSGIIVNKGAPIKKMKWNNENKEKHAKPSELEIKGKHHDYLQNMFERYNVGKLERRRVERNCEALARNIDSLIQHSNKRFHSAEEFIAREIRAPERSKPPKQTIGSSISEKIKGPKRRQMPRSLKKNNGRLAALKRHIREIKDGGLPKVFGRKYTSSGGASLKVEKEANFFQSSYLQVRIKLENMSLSIKKLTNNVSEFTTVEDFFLKVEKNFFRFLLSYSNQNQLGTRFDEMAQKNEMIRSIFLDKDEKPNRSFCHIFIYEHLFPVISQEVFKQLRSLHRPDAPLTRRQRRAQIPHSSIYKPSAVKRKPTNKPEQSEVSLELSFKNRKSSKSNIVSQENSAPQKWDRRDSHTRFMKRSTFNIAVERALVNDFRLTGGKSKLSKLNPFEFKSAGAYFREKNQGLRTEHYADEFKPPLELRRIPVENKFVQMVSAGIKVRWESTPSLLESFIERIKQLYIFNTKLLENYFEIKFNSLLHMRGAIADKKVLLKAFQGRILKDFYFSPVLDQSLFKNILSRIKSFDFKQATFSLRNNSLLQSYTAKTPVLYYYTTKLAGIAAKAPERKRGSSRDGQRRRCQGSRTNQDSADNSSERRDCEEEESPDRFGKLMKSELAYSRLRHSLIKRN